MYDHILIRLQRRYGRGKKQLPAADRGGNALDADLRAGRRAEREGSNTTRSERAQDERSAGRPPLQMKGRPLTHRTASAAANSVGPPQRGAARPSWRRAGRRRAVGLKQGVALRRLELDELDLRRQRGDRGLVFQLLRRGRLAPIGKRRHSAFVVLDHGARLVDLLLLLCEGSYELDAAARRRAASSWSRRGEIVRVSLHASELTRPPGRAHAATGTTPRRRRRPASTPSSRRADVASTATAGMKKGPW